VCVSTFPRTSPAHSFVKEDSYSSYPDPMTAVD
jgi:hypothetical protein